MLDGLYKPGAVAVIGASKNPLSIGYRVLANLRDYHFNGPIYPVNPKERSVAGFRAYKSVLDIPDDVDLVNISIPAKFVPQSIEECGRKGVKFAVVHSGGFREAGAEGAKLEEAVVATARKYGVRIYGPNSQGVMNSDPEVSLYANFTFTPMKEGDISILAQSGGVGELINLHLEEVGIGFRFYASNGNASDISIDEILEYFGRDEKTRVIALYVEHLEDPARFVEIASEITPRKPILCIKAGTSAEGARAISSHTGALMGRDTMSDVLLERAGIIRCHSQEQMVQAAIALSRQPLPKGNRVAIVTNAGGPAIQATDEAIARGLVLSSLSPETKKRLAAKVSPMSSLGNPVDLTATAGPEEFGHAVETLLADPEVDALLLSMVTPFFVDNEGILRKVTAALQEKPVSTVASYLTNRERWGHVVDAARKAGIPVYDYPETAAAALALMSRYAQIRARVRGDVEIFPCDDDRVQKILGQSNPGDFLPFLDAFEILRCCGIAHVPTAKYESLADLAKEAHGFLYPAVLKADVRGVSHKTEAGAVVLGIDDSETLLAHAQEMERKFPGPKFFAVQPMAKSDRELIVGVKRAGNAGAAIMVGMGGIFAEVVEDVRFGLVPVTRYDVRRMIEGLRCYPILAGARGEKPVDLEAVEEIALQLSQLAHRHPEIEEIDLNPVAVSPDREKTMALDVRMKLGGKRCRQDGSI